MGAMNEVSALHQHAWLPAGAPRASLVIAHGYGEHGARYAGFARALTEAGIGVYACDHRGHGLSPGARGAIQRFDHLVDDFSLFVESLRLERAATPVFLMGHSMGALILGHYILTQRPSARGIVFSSGVLKIGQDISPLLQRLSSILSLTVPWLPVVPIRPELTSRIPESVRRYAADPLICHKKMRAGTGHEILAATQRFQERMHEVELPLLVLHGTADRLTDPAGSRAFYEAAASADKTLKLYDGAYHEMMHDLNASEFTDDIRAWLSVRIG